VRRPGEKSGDEKDNEEDDDDDGPQGGEMMPIPEMFPTN
jgi:hypothetical protein